MHQNRYASWIKGEVLLREEKGERTGGKERGGEGRGGDGKGGTLDPYNDRNRLTPAHRPTAVQTVFVPVRSTSNIFIVGWQARAT